MCVFQTFVNEVHRWQHRVDEINALSASLADETRHLGLVAPPRMGEVSDTESEQGMRLAQSNMRTESCHHLETGEEPQGASIGPFQMIDRSGVQTEVVPPGNENDVESGGQQDDVNLGYLGTEDSTMKGEGHIDESQDHIKVMDDEDQVKEGHSIEGVSTEALEPSSEDPDQNGVLVARPGSQLSTHSDDTDLLMTECQETLQRSSSGRPAGEDSDADDPSEGRGSDVGSQCSENSTLALMTSLDEALNTDQAAMSFDSLASSSSTATLDGHVVGKPTQRAEWTGVPVLTSTGSLESEQVFSWLPSEETVGNQGNGSYGRAVVANMQPIIESADTLDTSLSLSLAATETESNSSLSASNVVYTHPPPGWPDIRETEAMEYEYLDKLATPRTPRDEGEAQYTGPNTPRALSVMSPRSGDQVNSFTVFAWVAYVTTTTAWIRSVIMLKLWCMDVSMLFLCCSTMLLLHFIVTDLCVHVTILFLIF